MGSQPMKSAIRETVEDVIASCSLVGLLVEVIENEVAIERELCARECEFEAAKWRGDQDISDFKICARRVRDRGGRDE